MQTLPSLLIFNCLFVEQAGSVAQDPALSNNAPVKVNVDNLVRAETAKQFDGFMATYTGGKINTWAYVRTPTPIDKQTVIRMNRDTLYSAAIVNISKGATNHKRQSWTALGRSPLPGRSNSARKHKSEFDETKIMMNMKNSTRRAKALPAGRAIDASGRCRKPVGDTVDIENATRRNTIGDLELIADWSDPDFDPQQRAFYYACVIEIPTPRWTAYEAKRFGIDMPADDPMKTQERAYTSPTWNTP